MADRIKISAEPRDDFGKGYARRLRKQGKIPAVIYGHGEAPAHVALPGHETMLAARNPNAILSVETSDKTYLTLIKDVQRHPIRPEIFHMDLLLVRRGERVEVEVPVVVEGEVAPGNISTQSETVLLLDVDALDVPEELLVDVSDRQDGEHVTAADVLLPEDVTLVSDPELIVVNVSAEVEQDLGEEPETDEDSEESAEGESSEDESGE